MVRAYKELGLLDEALALATDAKLRQRFAFSPADLLQLYSPVFEFLHENPAPGNIAIGKCAIKRSVKKANRAVLVLPAHTSAHRHKHLYTCIRVHARTLLTAVIITVNIVASLVHGRDSSTGLDLVERALGEGAFDDNMRCVPCARVNFSTQPAHSLLYSFTP